MDFETTTTDTIEQQLLRAEATIAQLKGAQMALLREIDPLDGVVSCPRGACSGGA